MLWNITEPLALNRYNYCVSSPLNYVDPGGHGIEIWLDIISLAADVVEFVKEPSWVNAGWVALDVAAIAIPFMPGSYAPKAAKGVANVVDAVDDVKDIGVAMKVQKQQRI